MLTGGAYMNGEIGSSVRSVGEPGPTMVYQPVGTTHTPHPHQSATQYSEHHHSGMNGMIMPQDLYGETVETAAELQNFNGSENKRGFNSHETISGQPAQAGHIPDLPITELKRMLLIQLEYYFSPENLAIDKYLVTQMDQDHYVPIATLATFNMVKKLTSDINLVTEVLRESANVQVHPDGKRVRPVSHRTVVILRGIPSSTSAEEIKNIFDNENCPKCTGCEFAFNDSWYVSFESDEDAMQAHRYLREDVREFKGHPIMARIKSKPTTLLSQGVAIGVPAGIKNGYSQPGGMMQSYMATATPFVPASQQQQTGANNGPASLYAPAQQVHQNVFPLPSNYPGFGQWPGYFDSLSMFSLNGLQPQGPSGYGKSAPMNNLRSRNLNPMRGVGPRRTMSSGSDSQVVSGTGGNNNGLQPQQHQQSYSSNNQPPRKNTAPVPAPLLGMVPQSLISHPSSHSNHHPSVPHNSIQNSSNQSTNGGRHYSSNAYSQSLPHVVDNGHYTRPYRGTGDSRPRSSMSSSSRRLPRRDEECSSYDYSSPGTSSSSNYRGNPSSRINPPVAVSPQIPAQLSVTNQNHQIDLDLEGSFPPLPGSANASSKNGEIRTPRVTSIPKGLSDVVKGFKGVKLDDGSSADKEGPNEIVVSAAEPGSSISSGSPGEVVVSAAQKEDSNDMSSHLFKKEYREIGVGSADENHDSIQAKTGVVSHTQTADKSTRTDEHLLYGDQPNGGNSRNNSQIQQTQQLAQIVGNNYRKSVTSQQGGASKSPIIPSNLNRVGVSHITGTEVPLNNPSPNSMRGAPSTLYPDNNRLGSGAGAGGTIVNPTSSKLSTDKEAFPAPNFVKVPTPASAKPFSGVTDHNPKESVRCSENERKESGQGDGKKAEDCSNLSNDEGPARLSYAQVAQSRKDAAAVHGPPTTSSSSSNSSSTSAAHTQINSPPQSSSGAQSFQDERKGRSSRDNKDTRNTRGNSDRDRVDQTQGRYPERNYRNRGPRSRVTSDASDTGSNSGASSRPPPARGPRSPK
ncbi:uncharacterized protein LOC110843934 isoform X2 [Folsomia candida]|uniref:uncharacterized protein LOC110843934 isoform X2 n=1 Tax=Folsomia candida TaxID=158441 RepID=UPI00160551B0|nr:uncharacterized protein LOC110843934 isoform X2 [Folsomia candida]